MYKKNTKTDMQDIATNYNTRVTATWNKHYESNLSTE